MINGSAMRIYGLYRHYILSMKRNPARIIEILIWPAVEVTLFALLAASRHDASGDTYGLTVAIITGILFWNFTARIIQETTAQFVDDYSSKNIQNIFVSPITLGEMLTSVTAASVTKLLFSLCALGAVIQIVYPVFFASVGPQVFLWIFQLEFMGIGLSFFAIAAVLLAGERVGFIGWMISTVVQIFSLVFYERVALLGILKYISYLIPSSYVFESIRAHVPGNPLLTTAQITAFLLSVTFLLIGTALVFAAYHEAKRRGTLTKL